MADNDGSLAAQVEAWMVSTIVAADAGKKLAEVGHLQGAISDVAQGQADELFRDRTPVVKVACVGGPAQTLSAESNQLASEYLVLVGVENKRPGAAARVGDAESVGVHWCRSLIRSALHGQDPDLSDDYYAAEVCELVGEEVAWQQANRWVIALRFRVAEVDKQS